MRILLCTDAAARGIDVTGLPFVINMTLPDRSEDYVHRTGRVGRAEAPGLAISLVSKVPERVWYCSKKGYKPWLKPSASDVKQHTIWYDEISLWSEVLKRLGPEANEIAPRREELGGGGRSDAPRCRRAREAASSYVGKVRRAVLRGGGAVAFWSVRANRLQRRGRDRGSPCTRRRSRRRQQGKSAKLRLRLTKRSRVACSSARPRSSAQEWSVLALCFRRASCRLCSDT